MTPSMRNGTTPTQLAPSNSSISNDFGTNPNSAFTVKNLTNLRDYDVHPPVVVCVADGLSRPLTPASTTASWSRTWVAGWTAVWRWKAPTRSA